MKIQELLSDETKWTQGADVRDKLNDPLGSIDDPEACKFCLFGAIYKCYSETKSLTIIIDRVRTRLNDYGISTWNDHPDRTFQDIQKLIKDLDI